MGGITIEIYLENKVLNTFYPINNQCYYIFATCQNLVVEKMCYDIMT